MATKNRDHAAEYARRKALRAAQGVQRDRAKEYEKAKQRREEKRQAAAAEKQKELAKQQKKEAQKKYRGVKKIAKTKNKPEQFQVGKSSDKGKVTFNAMRRALANITTASVRIAIYGDLGYTDGTDGKPKMKWLSARINKAELEALLKKKTSAGDIEDLAENMTGYEWISVHAMTFAESPVQMPSNPTSITVSP